MTGCGQRTRTEGRLQSPVQEARLWHGMLVAFRALLCRRMARRRPNLATRCFLSTDFDKPLFVVVLSCRLSTVFEVQHMALAPHGARLRTHVPFGCACWAFLSDRAGLSYPEETRGAARCLSHRSANRRSTSSRHGSAIATSCTTTHRKEHYSQGPLPHVKSTA
jgi:hypothetical protein